MKFHYIGKYKGEESLVAKRELKESDVKFKEPEFKAFAIIANALSFVLFFALAINLFPYILADMLQFVIGTFAVLLTMFPHELLHASCFKEDVYMYTDFSKGLLFVHGIEDMSKAGFVFMSLLPNIIFGFIPYIAWLVNHDLVWLGVMGATCLGMGAGDYINVFNALTQMPKGAKTFMSGTHSYWYLPNTESKSA